MPPKCPPKRSKSEQKNNTKKEQQKLLKKEPNMRKKVPRCRTPPIKPDPAVNGKRWIQTLFVCFAVRFLQLFLLLLAALGALFGSCLAALGRSSWAALGRSWGALGRSWVALGPLLERRARIVKNDAQNDRFGQSKAPLNDPKIAPKSDPK